MSLSKKCIAEFIGTMILVIFGCGVAVATGCEGNDGVVATALAFGLVIVAMAYSIGNVSGCHINPAVSLAMLLNKKMSGKEFAGYVISSLAIGLIAEIVLTFGFVLAILGVTSKTDNKTVTGIVIGLTLTLVHLLGIRLTGTSVNPARSLGPALLQMIGGDFTAISQIWIFIVGPLAGAALAALVYRFLDKGESGSEQSE